jgi:predicted O-linked N-acetylglucosamine transferase (SPINDLY family)
MQESNPRSTLERANAAHQAGDLSGAERLYQAALRDDSGNVEVLYRVSVLNAQLGRFDRALQLVDRALASNPGLAQLRFHRAELLAALRRTDAAVEAYRQALAIDPDHLDTLNVLGDLLNAAGRAVEALPLLERALALKPDYVPALNNRANALQSLGRSAEALQAFDRALESSPGNPVILFNRASALLSCKRNEEAEADCRQALAADPRNVGALFNLGRAQLRQRKHAAALATSDTLLAVQPGNAAAWSDRGTVLAAMHRHKEAWACFDKALAIDPDLPDAWYASAVLYSSFLQHEAALKCFRRLTALRPNNAEACFMLGEVLRTLRRDEEALIAFEDALRIETDYPFVPGQIVWLRLHRCSWEGVESEIEKVLSAVRAGKLAAIPLDLLALSGSAQDQLRGARIHVGHYTKLPAAPVWQGERYAHRRIRLAYVSADFRDHPVSYLIAGLLEQHDRSRFEVFGYSLTEEGAAPLAARVRGAFEHFSIVKEVSDAEVARQLREQEIDIAVDLMGHTSKARIGVFALRPCPVQVNYLGYPGTTGAGFHDYIIADPYVIPPGMERHYAEKVVRLPDSFQCNDSKRSAAARVMRRADAGLPEDGVIYCCFNNSAKFSPAAFDLWMRVLREVPGSVLWLFAEHPILQGNLRKEAQARGIDPPRLVFAPVVPYAEHLARLSLADVFLDTLPFNAGTTASDSLWAGVPVVTRSGEAFAARMAGSLLHAIGMPELIANTPEEYVALAVRLGSEPEFLASTKAKLAANRTTKPLFDTERFRKHIEAAYLAMWERAQRGEPPADLTVAAVSSARSTTQ